MFGRLVQKVPKASDEAVATIFCPEDGGRRFIRNIDADLQNYRRYVIKTSDPLKDIGVGMIKHPPLNEVLANGGYLN
jgi:hypothetical protein